MAGAGELLRAGEPGRAGADDRDALAGAARRHVRHDPALLPGAVDDRAFDRLDRHRIVFEVERAGRLARRGADAAGEFREIVGGVELVDRCAPMIAGDEIVPVGDEVIDRAAVVAKRNAAIHAALRLATDRRRLQWDEEFIPLLQPFLDRQIGPVLALDFEKACRVHHIIYLATASAGVAAASAWSISSAPR
jgi:hypothetical protein